ncbi:hypothetical protein FBULB1_7318 [Fusarium bulbicola]|nr:hypothetical protein FBULB1_7318 [Fusarium bulbicola]
MRLSPRVLHFCNEEVIWVCQTSQRSESGCNDTDYNDGKSFKPTLFSCVSDNLHDKAQFTWHRTVQEYSRLNITYESDKTIALAGVAQRMQRTRPNDRYLAGIWENYLPLDLLWMVWPTPKVKKPRLARYPSWSWASVSSQVMWDGNWSPLQSVVVKDVRYTSDGPSHMGDCSMSSITLHAPLIDVRSLLPTQVTPMRVWNGKVSYTVTPLEDIRIEEFCVHDYKPDVPSDGSEPTKWPPASGGFVIPLGIDVENSFGFCGIHVIKKLGGNGYERAGHTKISHDSLLISNYAKFLHRLKKDDALQLPSTEALESTSRAYAHRIRELLFISARITAPTCTTAPISIPVFSIQCGRLPAGFFLIGIAVHVAALAVEFPSLRKNGFRVLETIEFIAADESLDEPVQHAEIQHAERFEVV